MSVDAGEAAAAARDPQPLWAQVPPAARARLLRRTAIALLDEADDLAALLAEEQGLPRTEALLAELLPTVGGLHGLADDGPGALADSRLGRMPALRAGRRATLVRAPHGVVGVRSGPDAPWGERALDAAAAVLAGNAVLLASPQPRSADRLRQALERAGMPEGLVRIVRADTPLDEVCDHVVERGPRAAKATMLVLDGAPLARVVPGALWAACADAGRHPAAVGEIVVVPALAEPLLEGLEAAARRLRVGDPLRPETEIGPLRDESQADAVLGAVDEAVAAGATLLCGGRVAVPGQPGPFVAPMVLRGLAPDARVLRDRVPGPVLSVVEAGSEDEAIALARPAPGASTVSVWAGDRAKGERVARVLAADVAWVNDHGLTSPAVPVRLGAFVTARQLASQPTRLRSARWLPHDPVLVRARTTTAQLRHGREGDRWSALRRGAGPLARTAARLVREALGRRS